MLDQEIHTTCLSKYIVTVSVLWTDLYVGFLKVLQWMKAAIDIEFKIRILGICDLVVWSKEQDYISIQISSMFLKSNYRFCGWLNNDVQASTLCRMNAHKSGGQSPFCLQFSMA